ncbi:MAG: hypothetical protein ACSHX3_00130 [Litorimonas sp.]
MKQDSTLKFLEAEGEVLEAVLSLLGRVPGYSVGQTYHEAILDNGSNADALIEIGREELDHLLLVEVKSNGAPRIVKNAIYQLEAYTDRLRGNDLAKGRTVIPLLACPYLSPASRELCISANVSYLDLFGNVRIVADGLYIEISVPGRPKAEEKKLRSLFTPKAAAVLRVLFRDVEQAWKVVDLAEASNASMGHVSNVRKKLLEQDWAVDDEGGIRLSQPYETLAAWRDEFTVATLQTQDLYTHWHGAELEERLADVLNVRKGNPRCMLSRQSAATHYAPFLRDATQALMCDRAGVDAVRNALDLDRVSSGGNVNLRIIKDMTLFSDATILDNGLCVTDPLTTYLDLWSGSERDKEAAEHLARKMFAWYV